MGLIASKGRARAALLAVAGAGALLAAAATPDEKLAKALVERADAIRFPQTGYEVTVTVTSTLPGRESDKRRYTILSRGNDRTLVITTEPVADRGQILLMKERDLWIYMPSLSQPIRLPLAQRLTGQVANGDLARSNFAGDYDAKIASSVEIDGVPYYVLELTASEKGMTYNRLLYWINKANGRPHKAEFYGLSGRVLKTCRYENFVDAGGAKRPATVVMEDALTAGGKSVLVYSDFKLKTPPDKYFTKDYLKKL